MLYSEESSDALAPNPRDTLATPKRGMPNRRPFMAQFTRAPNGAPVRNVGRSL
jgi:hypothetical protein